MSYSKTCTYCKTTRPISEFRKAPNSPDGYSWRCKPCLNAQYKEYRRRNPRVTTDADLLRNRNFRLANPEKYREYRARHYQNHKETIREAQKRYLAARPGKNASLVRAYLARRAGNTVYKIKDAELRKMRLQPCFYCGAAKSGTIDHIVPISRGGQHSIGNLVPACRSCNGRKHNKFLIVWRIEKGEFK